MLGESTQNPKLAISLQYLKKEVSDKFDFLRGDKYQRFPQADIINFGGHI